MKRDILKDKQYWSERILKTAHYQKLDFEDLSNGNIKDDRINIVKRALAYSFIQILSAKYSAGYPILDLKEDLLKSIDLTYESWTGDVCVKFNYEGKYLNQFVEYDAMLWMLSIGYLLNIDDEDFNKLVNVIDRHKVNDNLFEFIIRAKIKNRENIINESYEYGWELFGKLRQAIQETDKSKAEKLIKDYITKDWYKEHKNFGWYNSHKRVNNTYFGYWSYETAAIVEIMKLDDSSFIDCQYYPKDFLHK